jgi:hypothetical protein
VVDTRPSRSRRRSRDSSRGGCAGQLRRTDRGGRHCVVILAADPSNERRHAVEQLLDGKPVNWKVADAPRSGPSSTAATAPTPTSSPRRSFDSDDQSAAAKKEGEVNLDDQAPIVQLVSRIVSQAMRDRTSDIHVEPLDDKLRIRSASTATSSRRSASRSASTPRSRAAEDHERHEHRREARPAGRQFSTVSTARRSTSASAASPPSSARRSSCESSTRAAR